MPIEFIKSDLFTIEAEAHVNTVNCVGVMGKGVAAECRKRYPELYRAYQGVCSRGELQPGDTWTWTSGSTMIFNVATKDHWRNPSQYIWVAKGLISLKKEILRTGVQSVAIPALGCGNGGLDWQKVRKMVIKCLSDLPVKIYVVEPIGLLSRDYSKAIHKETI